MDIRLIASDLDGTLMAPDHVTVTPATRAALTAAHEKGVKIAVATGRPLSLTDYVRNELPFIDYIISSNGAAAYDCSSEKLIFERYIDSEKTASLIKLFDNDGAYFNVYSGGKMYYKTGSQALLPTRVGIDEKFVEKISAASIGVKDMASHFSGCQSELIAAYFISDACRERLNKFVSENSLICVSSLADNVEIMAENAGKGSALRAICEKNGFNQAQIMAFGDASNDCSMLEFAAHSFAMANGDERCRRSAKAVAPPNSEDGVAQMIVKFAL